MIFLTEFFAFMEEWVFGGTISAVPDLSVRPALKYFTRECPTTRGGRYYIHFRDEEMKALSDLRAK